MNHVTTTCTPTFNTCRSKTRGNHFNSFIFFICCGPRNTYTIWLLIRSYWYWWSNTFIIFMTVWGKNHNPTLYIYWVIYLPITIFHNCCLSGPYLGKYKRDCNGTWFIDRWQWEEGQCTRTIIIPCILTKLSPLNHFIFS